MSLRPRRSVAAPKRYSPPPIKNLKVEVKDEPMEEETPAVTEKVTPPKEKTTPATSETTPPKEKTVPAREKTAVDKATPTTRNAANKATPATRNAANKAIPATRNAANKATPATKNATNKTTPTTNKATLSSSKTVPETSKTTPDISETTPENSTEIPSSSKTTSDVTKAVPETAPNVSKAIPTTLPEYPVQEYFVPEIIMQRAAQLTKTPVKRENEDNEEEEVTTKRKKPTPPQKVKQTIKKEPAVESRRTRASLRNKAKLDQEEANVPDQEMPETPVQKKPEVKLTRSSRKKAEAIPDEEIQVEEMPIEEIRVEETPIEEPTPSTAVQESLEKDQPEIPIDSDNNNQASNLLKDRNKSVEKVKEKPIVDKEKPAVVKQKPSIDKEKAEKAFVAKEKSSLDKEKMKEKPSTDKEKAKEKSSVDKERIKEKSSVDKEKLKEKSSGDKEKLKEKPSGDKERIKEKSSIDKDKSLLKERHGEKRRYEESSSDKTVTKQRKLHPSIEASSSSSSSSPIIKPHKQHSDSSKHPLVHKKSSDTSGSQQIPHKKSLDSKAPLVHKKSSDSSTKLPLAHKKSSDSSSRQPSMSSSNLFDQILDKQIDMCKDRNKTERQKAEELQRLEMERRKKSMENPYERGAKSRPPQPISANLARQSATPGQVKKPPLAPKKSSDVSSSSFGGGLGLLDDILGSQDNLWKERHKTEEQKAEELRRLEFQRRRVSAENPFEKAAQIAKDSKLYPSRQSTDTFKKPTLTTQKSTESAPKEPSPITQKSAESAPKEPSPTNAEKQKEDKKSPLEPATAEKKTPPDVSKTTPPEQSIAEKKTPPEQSIALKTTPSEQPIAEKKTPPEQPIISNVQPTNLPPQQPYFYPIIERVEDIPLPAPREEKVELPKSVPEVKHEEIVPQQRPQPKPSKNAALLDDILVGLNSLDDDEEDEEEEEVEEYDPLEYEHRPDIVENTYEEAINVSNVTDNADLLATANDILKTFQQQSGSNDSTAKPDITYEQIELSDAESTDSVKVEPEEKVQMEFYGEPVPDDDDNDDLFEIAAGIPKSKKDVIKKPIEEEPLPDNETIELDYYNADLNIKSDAKNKWLIDPENGDGFALMWGCVRSNYGLRLPVKTSERTHLPSLIVYQVRIKEFLPIKHLPFEENEPYDMRVGWSEDSVKSIIGESQHSYAYSTLGRKCHNNVFVDFGHIATTDDYITVLLDLTNNEMRIFINEDDLGAVYTDLQFKDSASLDEFAIIYPHIGIKNMRVQVNLGTELPDPESGAWPMPPYFNDKEYKFFGDLKDMSSTLAPTPRPPLSKADCTVIFMVGLPAAGKSRWVNNYLEEHSNERWIVVNAEKMLDYMRVNGVSRKRVHQTRWDAVMGLAAKAVTRALQLMCRRRHNYIIDQTNVSRDKRKQKLALFQDFVRKCAVLVPSAEEFEHRQMRQARDDRTDQITPEALLHLKGMFTLPETDQEPVEEVIFIEPPPERIGDAVELVRRFNEEGRPYLPVHHNQRRR